MAALPALGLGLAVQLAAQTFWTGPPITVTKPDGADWALEAHQDRITSNVWLTRGHTEGLFNIAVEPHYDRATGLSPLDTEWAFAGLNGNPAVGVEAANHASLTFASWVVSVGGAPPGSVGRAAVLHLITDDIYINLTFNSWSVGLAGGGGGFSYTRSTVPEPAAAGFLLAGLCAVVVAWRRQSFRFQAPPPARRGEPGLGPQPQ